MSLTLREAAEQVFELQAYQNHMEKRAEHDPKNARFDEDNPEFETRSDEAAQLIADTPHLTGDPEWDAIELAETDPSRPLLKDRLRGM